jgi:large subunit ribosomal protein L15
MVNNTYLGLHNLMRIKSHKKRPKRVGRGESSGWGKTSGRGHKGQKARKSGNTKFGFEGGQTPLIRRLPKRGFKNIKNNYLKTINMDKILANFPPNAKITFEVLKANNIIKTSKFKGLKLVKGVKSIHPLSIIVDQASKILQDDIQSVGGSIKIIKKSSTRS